MKASDFISNLQTLDIRLTGDGERLRVDAPNGTVTAELRAQIAERKAELLMFLRDQPSFASSILPPIPRRETKDRAPLSFAQERMWFLEQLEPGSTVYNICRASRLSGSLNIAALEASLREIVRRHEVLRSAVQVVDGRPLQVPVSSPKVMVRLLDLHALTLVDRDEEIRRQITGEAERPFDLSVGVFLRCTLLRVGDAEHVLILTTHHIASDAWSIGLLRRELWALYDSYATNKSCPFKDLPIQYADYAIWQRNQLQYDGLDSQLSYWKNKLKGITGFDLPADRCRPAQFTHRGARTAIALPASLTKELKELSEQLGVTLFMTLVAAFNVLLHRYSAHENIAIGTPVANRNRPELQELIGLFVNTLVLRTDLSGSPKFRDLLFRVRDMCLEAYAHQELPFEKLVEELHPNRELSRNPLFQAMFVLNNAPQVTTEIAGIEWRRIAIDPGTAKFDLTLALAETEGGLQGSIEYSTDLFDPPTIERMAGHWQTLLEGIVADPNQQISTLPLLTAQERHQLLVSWNDTAADYPKDMCIHELFEAQVERSPDALALECEGKQITYRDLNRKANQLSHYLISLGIAPEKLVGICVERSIEMVVGLLAILKAGGAYLPLDPGYPKERLRFMLEDSQVSVLLTQETLVEDREWREDDDSRSSIFDPRRTVVCLDRDRSMIEQERTDNPEVPIATDNPAYVIYTSGSTGVPKGVLGLHQGTVNRMAWMWKAYPFVGHEKNCLKTSLSFVDSVWEIFGALVQGVPTLIIGDDTAKDPRALIQTLAGHRITRIVLVPSLLRAILDDGPTLQEDLPQRMIWTSSGEPLPSALVDQFERCLPNSLLLNLYGSSEVAGDVTCLEIRGTASGTRIPIGRPIINTRIYLLDTHRQLVPVGLPGELYVGGASLARGYLNRPELTLGKFIIDPFSSDSDARLYRTGDLARYLPDGKIEFLGRIDRQVKLRGYRIELGEIESTLNQHPWVKESFVVAHNEDFSKNGNASCQIENPKSDVRLVSYVVRKDPSAVSVSDLQSFLREELPTYMLPSVFIFVNALALTPNGKIDCKALPPVDGASAEIARGFVAPRTEIEELVAQTWQEVLKLDRIGVDDNFFDIGGHSILAIQIVSRLRDTFNREVGVRSLFEKPTVAALAEEIEELIRDGSAPRLPPVEPVQRNENSPLSINQEQMWHLEKVIPGTHFFNMSYVYQLRCELNVKALERALKQIVRRHEALRTVFSEVDGNPVQVVKDGADFQVIVVDLRKYSMEKSFERAADLILEEREQSFDVATGPLIRAKILRLTDMESCLLLALHHIIGDHWSMQVLRRELIAVYESILKGHPSDLPPLRIQFGDFAAWERKLINGGSMAHQVAYWKEQLSEPLPELQFQKTRGKRSRSGDRRVTQEIEITGALFAAVKSLANSENCSVSMVMLAALSVVLYSYTNQRDIRIGTLVANRRCSDTEGVFGHFLNTVVIRTLISPGMTCAQLLKQVRTTTIEAYAHQELPFEKLAQVLEEERNIDRASLFQVLCNYQKVQPEPPRPAGITIAPFQVARVVGPLEAPITAIEMIFDVKETLTLLTVSVNRRSGVLNKSQSLRMKEHLTSILQALVVQTTTVESLCVEV